MRLIYNSSTITIRSLWKRNQCQATNAVRSVIVVISLASQAHAWNALGHKVIAEIAWQQLDAPMRQRIVETIKRHPAFAKDFAPDMPTVDTDRWIFQQAATWPDIARGGPYDRPTWHYVNEPVFVNSPRRVTANLSTDPGQTAPEKYNCIQAFKHCLATIKDDDAGDDAKALAYCWLFHLVGDMHQPLHAVALYGDYFPDGDKGGNEIPLARGRNLHSLWDNLLGRDSRMSNVQRVATQLPPMDVDAKAGPEVWIAESQHLAETFVYDPIILAR